MILSQKLKTQKGFSILAVILVIVAVIVAIGVWAISGSSNNNNSKNSAVLAATIINQGVLYKSQLEKYRITSEKGGLIDGNIVLSPNTSGELNLFDPVNGMEVIKPPKAALQPNTTFPLGVWAINPTSFSTNEDNTDLYMYTAFLVGGVTKSVCENINSSLYNTKNIPIFTNTFLEVVPDISTTNYRSVLPVHLYNISEVKGWSNGCLLHYHNSNPREYFYFQVVR